MLGQGFQFLPNFFATLRLRMGASCLVALTFTVLPFVTRLSFQGCPDQNDRVHKKEPELCLQKNLMRKSVDNGTFVKTPQKRAETLKSLWEC